MPIGTSAQSGPSMVRGDQRHGEHRPGGDQPLAGGMAAGGEIAAEPDEGDQRRHVTGRRADQPAEAARNQHRGGEEADGGEHPADDAEPEIAPHRQEEVAVDEDRDRDDVGERGADGGDGVEGERAEPDGEGDEDQRQRRPVAAAAAQPKAERRQRGDDEGGIGDGVERLRPQARVDTLAVGVDRPPELFPHARLSPGGPPDRESPRPFPSAVAILP